MKRSWLVVAAAVALVAAGAGLRAGAADSPDGMSKAQRVALARSGAPASIGQGARVMDLDADGNLVELAPGTNDFTCVPDDPTTPKADPLCADPAAWEFVTSMLAGAPKPSNTVPGFSYMAKGGQHWEKDGKILMEKEDGARLVDEPPHWMLFWPFSSKETGLPSLPSGGPVYVMFDGTPYAHLMVYQDPNKLK